MKKEKKKEIDCFETLGLKELGCTGWWSFHFALYVSGPGTEIATQK